MAETTKNNLKRVFGLRLFLLVGLLGTLIYQLNDDLTLLNFTPTQVPFFLKYLIFLVFIGLIVASFDDSNGYSRRNTIHGLISIVLLLISCIFVAYFFDKQDLLNAINKSYFSPFNFKTPKGIESYKDLLKAFIWLPLTIIVWTTFLFSSILLLLNLSGIFGKSKGKFNYGGVLFITSIAIVIISVGILTHYFIQQSFNENFKSYLSEELNGWQLEAIFFALITIILLAINSLNISSWLADKEQEIEKLTEKIKKEYVKIEDYDKKYTHVTKFDKYGLALTRIEKEFDGKKDREFYGIINRFGVEILPNKYYFGAYNIQYYKNYPLIIVEELETRKMGVIDIYGNWIIEVAKQSISFPNRLNPSNETWDTHEKYLSLNDSTLLDINDMILEVKDLENDKTENTERGYTVTYNGYYLNKLYDLINMKIVRVVIRD